VNDTSLTEKSVDDEVRLSKETGLSLSLFEGKAFLAKAMRKEGKVSLSLFEGKGESSA